MFAWCDLIITRVFDQSAVRLLSTRERFCTYRVYLFWPCPLRDSTLYVPRSIDSRGRKESWTALVGSPRQRTVVTCIWLPTVLYYNILLRMYRCLMAVDSDPCLSDEWTARRVPVRMTRYCIIRNRCAPRVGGFQCSEYGFAEITIELRVSVITFVPSGNAHIRG